MKAQPFKVAIAGTGSMAHTMAEQVVRHEALQLSSVFSHSSSRAIQFAKEFDDIGCFDDLSEMLVQTKPNLLYIATSNRNHVTLSLAALRAKVAVVCEKPCATTCKELEELLKTAAANNTLFMEAFWTLFLPSYRKFIELGASDPPKNRSNKRLLVSKFGYPFKPRDDSDYLDPQYGGVLLDRAGYGVALSLSMFGDIDAIYSDVHSSGAGVDTHASARMLHVNGAISELHVSFDFELENQIVYCDEEQKVSLLPPMPASEALVRQTVYRGNHVEAQLSVSTKLKKKLLEFSLVRRIKMLISILILPSWYGYSKDKYLPMIDHVVSLLESGKVESEVVSHKLSLQVLQTIFKIKRKGSEPK